MPISDVQYLQLQTELWQTRQNLAAVALQLVARDLAAAQASEEQEANSRQIERRDP